MQLRGLSKAARPRLEAPMPDATKALSKATKALMPAATKALSKATKHGPVEHKNRPT